LAQVTPLNPSAASSTSNANQVHAAAGEDLEVGDGFVAGA
jgi:hypothetical protein